MPKRIQRKRAKGWKMPRNAVYVGRPTRWGNPFRAGVCTWCSQRELGILTNPTAELFLLGVECMTVQEAVVWYRVWARVTMRREFEGGVDWLAELRGKNLACWCPLDQPCHADVLLELANGGR